MVSRYTLETCSLKIYALLFLKILIYIYIYYYGSTALCWALAAFLFFLILYTVGTTPWARRKAYTYIQNNTHKINAHNTDIHALSGIRTHDPSVRVNEDSSCLRLRGHHDRQ
jgi:hypothetical protein